MWTFAHKQKNWSSAHRHKCGHLLTDKSAVIYSQTKMWSSTDRQKCGRLLTDKSVATCFTTSVFYAWSLLTIGSAKCDGLRESAAPVEEVLRRVPGHELVTQLQDLARPVSACSPGHLGEGGRPHQLAQPGGRVPLQGAPHRSEPWGRTGSQPQHSKPGGLQAIILGHSSVLNRYNFGYSCCWTPWLTSPHRHQE